MDFLKQHIKWVAPFLVLPSIIIAGCDPTFEPLIENNRYLYSINGLLDTSLDTQWVRVTEVRDAAQPPMDSVPLNAVVTLEHLESEEYVVLNDSLLSFRGINTGERAQSYNYWTNMDIVPEQTYRLSVTSPEGETSDVTVTIPPDYPAPSFTGNNLYFDFEDEELIADVSLVFYSKHILTDEIRRVVLPKKHLIRETSSNQLRILMSQEFVTASRYISDRLDPQWPITKMGVYTAFVGPDWPFENLSIQVEQDPDAVSNVQNGVGFVGGISSHFIPICFEEQTFVPCPEEE